MILAEYNFYVLFRLRSFELLEKLTCMNYKSVIYESQRSKRNVFEIAASPFKIFF